MRRLTATHAGRSAICCQCGTRALVDGRWECTEIPHGYGGRLAAVRAWQRATYADRITFSVIPQFPGAAARAGAERLAAIDAIVGRYHG